MLSPIEIERLLKFNPDDLEFNRNGQLSDRQKQRLLSDFDSQRFGGITVGLIFMGIGLWLFFSQKQYLIGIVFAGLGFLMALLLWLMSHVSADDLHVKHVSGYLEKKMDESSETSDYYLHIDKFKIQVDQKVYDAFSEGDLYTLYYYHRPIFSWLTTGPHLISVETPAEKRANAE